MSRLSELIAELCPDGVEYKPLSSLGKLTKGKGLQKKDFSETGVGCIHYGQIYTRLGMKAYVPLTYVPAERADSFTWVKPGDIVIAVTSENVDDVCKAVLWLGDERIVTGAHAVVFHAIDVEPVYVAYFLQTSRFQQRKSMIVDGVKVIEMKVDQLGNVVVPVPPIEVQREIVRILDSFQELDDALTAEIEAREKQLVSVADELILRSVPQIDWKPLNEVGQLQRGKRFTFAQMSEVGDLGCIHYGDVYFLPTAVSEVKTFLNSNEVKSPRLALPGDVVFSCTSEITETVGRAVAWLGSQPVAVHDDCQIFHHDMDATYVSYFAQTRAFNTQKMRGVTRSKIARLSGEWLGKVRIPVPSPSRQHEIAEHLSSIEVLAGQLRIERDIRRKQFAYYRDKLLSFPEKVTVNG